MTRLSHLAVFLTTVNAVVESEAFATTSDIMARPKRPSHGSRAPSKVSMSIDDMVTLSSPLLSTTFTMGVPLQLSPLLSASPTVAVAMVTDPAVEAEVFNDMAHVALDVATLFGPATAALRLLAVIGRLFTIAGDYLPDHTILSEEAIFQLAMLAVATNGLVKSAIPMIASASATTTFRDQRAYQVLFSHAGVSWPQYRAMAALALDWIEVEPGFIITSDEQATDDENIYWLYSGGAEVQSGGTTIQAVSRQGNVPKRNESNLNALLGEMGFARRLDDDKKTKKNKSSASVKRTEASYPKTTIKAGPSGATLLRINTPKLTTLMDNDEQLAQSIRRLLVTGMQEKLSAVLASSSIVNA